MYHFIKTILFLIADWYQINPFDDNMKRGNVCHSQSKISWNGFDSSLEKRETVSRWPTKIIFFMSLPVKLRHIKMTLQNN